jgi:hypothetical protein
VGRYASDKGGGDFQQCPVGSHVAICVELIDLGTQHGEYQGKPNTRNQVVIRWETPSETMEDGQPFLVSAFFTNSLGEKATLRPILESWRGRAFTPEELASFDLQAILGKPCLISVIHNEKGKAKVNAVMQLPKGTPVPPVHNKLKSFWINEWDSAAFEALPEFFKAKIMESDEYVERQIAKSKGGGGAHFADMSDDVPFAPIGRGAEAYVI